MRLHLQYFHLILLLLAIPLYLFGHMNFEIFVLCESFRVLSGEIEIRFSNEIERGAFMNCSNGETFIELLNEK